MTVLSIFYVSGPAWQRTKIKEEGNVDATSACLLDRANNRTSIQCGRLAGRTEPVNEDEMQGARTSAHTKIFLLA